ncbi:MAG: (2Fe-2S)-binding protein, partial [Planctomycetes bacterium]|nr:(2Fe-2S)-binding protein [Planctomycetota bacterium]
MVRLTIDNQSVEVDDGATILDAAEKLGIEIPTICFLKGCSPSTSCMVCVVRLADSDKMVPACGTIAQEGMTVVNDCDQVRQARITALELLLSDHAGDCIGPCQIGCPAKMNIPLMIRQIAAGDLDLAITTIKEDIALPAVLGRICPAPCEKVCRRNQLDEALSICLLKRYAADMDLHSSKPYKPKCAPANGKRVAIAGAGPAGLSAAYYLARKGYACTIFDDHDEPGGALRYEIARDQLPGDVLDDEIAQIVRLGVKFQPNTRIGKDKSLDKLCKSFDAVFLAVGRITPEEVEKFGLKAAAKGIAVDSNTYQTDRPNIFAGGDAVRDRKLAVRSVADGKEAAVAIDQYLSSKTPTGPEKPFNTRIGRLEEDEVERFKACAGDAARQTPVDSQAGFSPAQAAAESSRCLHCDCRKPDACKLRKYSQEYHARPGRYKGPRRLFEQQIHHSEVIYESGKCIDCGLCIQITAQE